MFVAYLAESRSYVIYQTRSPFGVMKVYKEVHEYDTSRFVFHELVHGSRSSSSCA